MAIPPINSYWVGGFPCRGQVAPQSTLNAMSMTEFWSSSARVWVANKSVVKFPSEPAGRTSVAEPTTPTVASL